MSAQALRGDCMLASGGVMSAQALRGDCVLASRARLAEVW